MYITTFRSIAGPGASQRSPKGNTITFPQDIVKIAKILPAESNILADCLKVIFIESEKPSKVALIKIFTVLREKVHNALLFLVDNHPLYFNIQLSQDIDLPDDDIPDEIWSMMTLHDDTGKEDKKEHTTYTPQTDT